MRVLRAQYVVTTCYLAIGLAAAVRAINYTTSCLDRWRGWCSGWSLNALGKQRGVLHRKLTWNRQKCKPASRAAQSWTKGTCGPLYGILGRDQHLLRLAQPKTAHLTGLMPRGLGSAQPFMMRSGATAGEFSEAEDRKGAETICLISNLCVLYTGEIHGSSD